MGICFVTILRTSVTNSSLPKFNTLYVEANLPTHDTATKIEFSLITTVANADVTHLKIVGGAGKFISPGSGVDLSNDVLLNKMKVARKVIVGGNDYYEYLVHASLGKYTIEIDNKGDFAGIVAHSYGGINFDIDTLKYLKNLYDVNINKDNFGTNNAKGDISALSNKSYLTHVYLSYCNVTGNIDSLAGNTNLTEIGIASTAVEGSIESFASKQISAGRTSGTVLFRAENSRVTYNGQILKKRINVTYNQNSYSVADA